MSYSFIALDEGHYQFCIENKDTRDIEFDFVIQSGVEAIDYDSIVTKNHLKPVEMVTQ